MHTVCETRAFRRSAREAGMSDEDIEELVAYLAENPLAGDEIVGTGGCRKVRFGGKGKGKSGGYRSVTFFSGTSLPLFLVTVFAKGQRADLTQAERNELKKMAQALSGAYASRVTKVGEAG